MAIRESYVDGTPSFVDLATSDQGAAKSFYGELFGWTYDDMPMGPGAIYSLASLRGKRAAAIVTQQPEQAAAGVPPHWQMYITNHDLDAATAKVADAGGSVHMGPIDVFDAGRMTVVQDPAGAFFMLWEPKTNIGCERVNEPGAFTWSELVAAPNDKTGSFYEAVTGLQLIEADMGDGAMYGGFSLDGTPQGMLAGTVPPPAPGMPAYWGIYFGSADVDVSTARVSELGGSIMVEPFDIPIGRMAVCVDPQGAPFSLFSIDSADD